jgi:hypothetical protein
MLVALRRWVGIPTYTLGRFRGESPFYLVPTAHSVQPPALSTIYIVDIEPRRIEEAIDDLRVETSAVNVDESIV